MSTHAAGNGGVALSQKELALLVSAFSSSTTELKPDYETIAAELGYANNKVAATMWSTLRRKIFGPANSRSSATAAGTSPKKVGDGNSPKKVVDSSPSKKATAASMRHKSTPNDKPTTVSRYINFGEEGNDDDGDAQRSGTGSSDDEDQKTAKKELPDEPYKPETLDLTEV